MRARLALLAWVPAVVAAGARAEVPSPSLDGVGWLGRIAVAAQKYNYTGVFVYQNGPHSETTRIVHAVEAGGERERLESLEGSPREVLRANGEVKCYLPAQQKVLLQKEGARRGFPASFPGSLSVLGESYVIRKGEVVRVAGQESQQILLEPRDGFRHGHMLWADVGSGLLLKARMVNDRRETLEQFAFTQVQIGGPVDPSALKSRLAATATGWQVFDARNSEEMADARGWVFRNSVPGFRKTSSMRRRTGQGGAETVHLVFSDGMAAVSVFIEPLPKEKAEQGLYSMGATNIYKRIAGDRLMTVLGEVPALTLKRLGDGIEKR